MLKQIIFVFLLAFTIACFAEDSKTNWQGKYFYGENLGKTAAASNMFLGHKLYIKQENRKNCEFEVMGYQTDEKIICTIQIQKNKITVLFKSYSDGETENAWGNDTFKVNEPMFSLIWKNQLLTIWQSNNLIVSEGKLNKKPNLYFKKLTDK